MAEKMDWDAKYENLDSMSEEARLNQGERASEIFEGKVESEPVKKIFGESADLIASIIRNNLPEIEGQYSLADFGTYKGELLKNVCKLLKEYDFHTIGIDLEKNLKKNDSVDEKIAADLGALPLKDSSIDIGIARHVLHWNNFDKQKMILREIVRTVKKLAIVQHVGADNNRSSDWCTCVDDALDGKEIVKLERHGHFFSSSEELEKWMMENGIRFKKVKEIRVDGLSEILSQRFSLDKNESEELIKMLYGSDYIFQTTWIILPRENERQIEI